MRGTLVPSVKVARTMSYWPSMPKKPPQIGMHVPLELEFAAAEDRVALRIDRLAELQPCPARRMHDCSSQVLPVSRRKMKPSKRV